MNWHVTPYNGKWQLRKERAARASGLFELRRDAIKAARAEVKKKDGVIYVHNSTGFVVVRIPELPAPQKVAAEVWFKQAAGWSPKGRKEIAAWLRRTAADLVKHGDQYATNMRARYHYS